MERVSQERNKNFKEETKPEEVGEAYAELCSIDTIGMSVADELARFFDIENIDNQRVLDDLNEELTIQPFATTQFTELLSAENGSLYRNTRDHDPIRG